MIGQEKLLDKVDRLIENGFPRFVLLVGSKGSGKKLMCMEIAKKLGYPLVSMGTGVDEVREVIQNSYRNTEPILYVIPDTDKMSVQAKNAMLKITEEPPQKAYFLSTVTNTSNTLQTIISRACVLKMDDYSQEELKNYLLTKYPDNELTNNQIEFILNVATVPEQVDILMNYNVEEFSSFVNTGSKHLHTVSSANAFKIELKLALKKDEDKWDVLLFLQALKYELLNNYYNLDEHSYFESYILVCDTIKEIQYKNSVNKQYCMDSLILGIRECWRQE